MSLLVPSGSPSFTSLPHHHVSIGPQRVSFLHPIAPPPCLYWSPAGLLPSPHCPTTMYLLVPSGSPSCGHRNTSCPEYRGHSTPLIFSVISGLTFFFFLQKSISQSNTGTVCCAVSFAVYNKTLLQLFFLILLHIRTSIKMLTPSSPNASYVTLSSFFSSTPDVSPQ